MKILAVDDDPRIREALEVGLQLQWQDAQVFSAGDGEAGLDAVAPAVRDLELALHAPAAVSALSPGVRSTGSR